MYFTNNPMKESVTNSMLEQTNGDSRSPELPHAKCSRLLFNIFVGQCIAAGMVSGGIFTKNLQNMGMDTPLLQLSIMYFPLSFYLIYHL